MILDVSESPKVTLQVRYELGHSYRETWEPEDTHCPNCGAKPGVWRDAGAGDYYEGPAYLCAECASTWTMPRLEACHGWQDEQRLEAIRSAPSEPPATVSDQMAP